MLILLPPSEGKTDATDGPALDLAELSLPSLTPHRLRVAKALVKVGEGRPNRARQVLGLSQRQDGEIERDRQLFTRPTAPAFAVYSGVVYDALAYQRLPRSAQRQVDHWVLVSSALWGCLRMNDWIPAYRLSADVTLPRIGTLKTYWRRHLRSPMDAAADECGPILDLRSGSYSRMWTPSGDVAAETIVGRVVQRFPDGSTKVVSHHNKATKGQLVRALALQGKSPSSGSELVEAIGLLGYRTNLVKGTVGQPARLDIAVDAV